MSLNLVGYVPPAGLSDAGAYEYHLTGGELEGTARVAFSGGFLVLYVDVEKYGTTYDWQTGEVTGGVPVDDYLRCSFEPAYEWQNPTVASIILIYEIWWEQKGTGKETRTYHRTHKNRAALSIPMPFSDVGRILIQVKYEVGFSDRTTRTISTAGSVNLDETEVAAAQSSGTDISQLAEDGVGTPIEQYTIEASAASSSSAILISALREEEEVTYTLYPNFEYEVLPGDFTHSVFDRCMYRGNTISGGSVCKYYQNTDPYIRCALRVFEACSGWEEACAVKVPDKLCVGRLLQESVMNADSVPEITKDNVFVVYNRRKGMGLLPPNIYAGANVYPDLTPLMMLDFIGCYELDPNWERIDSLARVPCFCIGQMGRQGGQSLEMQYYTLPIWRWVRQDGTVDYRGFDSTAVELLLKERDIPHYVERNRLKTVRPSLVEFLYRRVGSPIGYEPKWEIPDWFPSGRYEVWFYGKNTLVSSVELVLRTFAERGTKKVIHTAAPVDGTDTTGHSIQVGEHTSEDWHYLGTIGYHGAPRDTGAVNMLSILVDEQTEDIDYRADANREFSLKSLVLRRVA